MHPVGCELKLRRGAAAVLLPSWGGAWQEEGFEALGVDVEVALVAAEAELAAEFQAHIADVALAVEGAVAGGFEAVRVQGAERVAGEQGAGGVQVELAVGAVVHPAVRGHALVAEVALQVPRRVGRLEEQLEREGVERRQDPLPQLGAARVHVKAAILAPVAPLAVRQRVPAPVAFLPGPRVVALRHERQRVRVREAPQRRLQRATRRVQVILTRLAMVRRPLPEPKTQVAYKIPVRVGRLVVKL